MIKEYKMFIDRKLTIWERQEQTIEATSLEEAEKIFHENLSNAEVRSELIYETIDNMTTKENSDNPTEELFLESDTAALEIWDNMGTDFSAARNSIVRRPR